MSDDWKISFKFLRAHRVKVKPTGVDCPFFPMLLALEVLAVPRNGADAAPCTHSLSMVLHATVAQTPTLVPHYVVITLMSFLIVDRSVDDVDIPRCLAVFGCSTSPRANITSQNGGCEEQSRSFKALVCSAFPRRVTAASLCEALTDA